MSIEKMINSDQIELIVYNKISEITRIKVFIDPMCCLTSVINIAIYTRIKNYLWYKMDDLVAHNLNIQRDIVE